MTKKKNETLKVERVPFQFQLDPSKSDFESGKFIGVASVFGSVVDTIPNRTRFRRGAFLRTINDRASRIKILSVHDQGTIWIGLPTRLQETENGLLVEASLNNTQAGRDAAEALRHASALGKLDAAELSVGFDAINFEMVELEDGEVLREITEARLWEVSVVNFGADRQTRIMEAARLDLEAQSADPHEAFTAEILSNTEKLVESTAPQEEHAGRVLSSKNKTRIKEAIKALQELLEIADPPKDDDAAKDKRTSKKQALEAEYEAIDAEILAMEAEFLAAQHGVLQR